MSDLHNSNFIGEKYFSKRICGNVLVVSEEGLGLLFAFESRVHNVLAFWDIKDKVHVKDLEGLKVEVLGKQDVIRGVKGEQFDYIWFEGSTVGMDYLLQLVYNQRRFNKTKLFAILPAGEVKKAFTKGKPQFKWMRIKHSKIGGLSTSSWMLAYPADTTVGTVYELAPAYGLKRSLKDVVKHNESGKTIQKTEELPETVSLINLDKTYFQLPSVFSTTKYVERRLTPYELGCVMDISERTSKALSSELLSTLLKSTPGKVCQVGINMLFVLEDNESLASVESGPGDIHSESLTEEKSNKRRQLLVNPSDLKEEKELTAEEAYLIRYGEKAAKNDDEEVPAFLWDIFLCKQYLPHINYSEEIHGKALATLRSKFFLLCWRRKLMTSFRRYLAATYGSNWVELLKLAISPKQRKRKIVAISSAIGDNTLVEIAKDVKVGMDGIVRVANGGWWTWDNGSTLFFWRWHASIRKAARDGFPCFIERRLPQYKKKQRVPSDARVVAQMREKLENVINKNYIEVGKVKSLINCFPVPKGENDIRLVYDGTKSELNAKVWAPNFFLPSVDSLLMVVDVDTWFADLDLGEMFLNYFMEERIRPYAGVDLTEIFNDCKGRHWRRWGRLFMGYSESPFFSNKFFAWCIDMIKGSRLQPSNPFRWNKILVNLPGQESYNPARPRLCKLWNEKIAADLSSYVDDVRPTGSSEVECKRAYSRIAQILQYLGQQNAARKYRPPSKRPGPWCGSFCAVQDGCVWVYVSQEKWNKAKLFVDKLSESLLSEADYLTVDINRKFLEKGRGFMVYFCRTYASFTPFLKGIHLTLESWRNDRDDQGWKMKKAVTQDDLEVNQEAVVNDFDEELADLYLSDSDDEEDELTTLAPKVMTGSDVESVKPVPRLLADVLALQSLLEADTPPWRFVRGKLVLFARYGFGDASKEGFGASFELEDGKIWYRFGAWGSEEKENSSNFRELTNLVETMELKLSDPKFTGGEIFLFTDNSVAEAAFHKGTSSNRSLFNLVLRMKKLELKAGCKIHVIHVAGTRMIAQGSDGLSRGDLNEGVMKGLPMHSFIPLHLSALERQPKLKDLLASVIPPARGQQSVEFLAYQDWFERAHDICGGECNSDGIWTPSYRAGTFIWSPPPAAALIAVEQMRMARLKRENSTHIFVIPRLMTAEWKRQLFRASDLFLELPFDDLWCKETQHEPLTIAFIFPFLPHSPWQLKRSKAFLGMDRYMRRMWKETGISHWSLLQQLCVSQRKMDGLSESVVRQMLSSPQRLDLPHPTAGK